mmetsp:Transcript_10802/g.25852  ORF Transcript_10802/g.25852 Transcript_10802/m.25852 type:complete len:247 (+) Transcript_10802:1069-1809(+)
MVTVLPFRSLATVGTAAARAGECSFLEAATGGRGSTENVAASEWEVPWTGSDFVRRASGDKDLLSACKKVFFTQLCQFRLGSWGRLRVFSRHGALGRVSDPDPSMNAVPLDAGGPDRVSLASGDNDLSSIISKNVFLHTMFVAGAGGANGSTAGAERSTAALFLWGGGLSWKLRVVGGWNAAWRPAATAFAGGLNAEAVSSIAVGPERTRRGGGDGDLSSARNSKKVFLQKEPGTGAQFDAVLSSA